MGIVKVCGLTREEDVELAVEAGADLAGFVFAPGRRRVDPERAAALRRRLDGTAVRAVGVFVDETPERIGEIVDAVRLDLVQLHGDEPPRIADRIGPPIIRAVRIGKNNPPFARNEWTPRYFLLDTYDPGAAGGTGRVFDWTAASETGPPRPFLLAGGLTPENVAEAIQVLRPDGVDVSSGVEDRPGIKCEERVKRFVAAARAAFDERERESR